MEYKIIGQVEIDSAIDVKGVLNDELKSKIKKDLEKSFVNAFDSVCEKYKIDQESVHSIFLNWLDFELE